MSNADFTELATCNLALMTVGAIGYGGKIYYITKPVLEQMATQAPIYCRLGHQYTAHATNEPITPPTEEERIGKIDKLYLKGKVLYGNCILSVEYAQALNSEDLHVSLSFNVLKSTPGEWIVDGIECSRSVDSVQLVDCSLVKGIPRVSASGAIPFLCSIQDGEKDFVEKDLQDIIDGAKSVEIPKISEDNMAFFNKKEATKEAQESEKPAEAVDEVEVIGLQNAKPDEEEGDVESSENSAEEDTDDKALEQDIKEDSVIITELQKCSASLQELVEILKSTAQRSEPASDTMGLQNALPTNQQTVAQPKQKISYFLSKQEVDTSAFKESAEVAKIFK